MTVYLIPHRTIVFYSGDCYTHTTHKQNINIHLSLYFYWHLMVGNFFGKQFYWKKSTTTNPSLSLHPPHHRDRWRSYHFNSALGECFVEIRENGGPWPRLSCCGNRIRKYYCPFFFVSIAKNFKVEIRKSKFHFVADVTSFFLRYSSVAKKRKFYRKNTKLYATETKNCVLFYSLSKLCLFPLLFLLFYCYYSKMLRLHIL